MRSREPIHHRQSFHFVTGPTLRTIAWGGPISPTIYAQLLRTQIPKAQKDSQLKQLFALSGSAGVKAARKHVDEIDP